MDKFSVKIVLLFFVTLIILLLVFILTKLIGQGILTKKIASFKKKIKLGKILEMNAILNKIRVAGEKNEKYEKIYWNLKVIHDNCLKLKKEIEKAFFLIKQKKYASKKTKLAIKRLEKLEKQWRKTTDSFYINSKKIAINAEELRDDLVFLVKKIKKIIAYFKKDKKNFPKEFQNLIKHSEEKLYKERKNIDQIISEGNFGKAKVRLNTLADKVAKIALIIGKAPKVYNYIEKELVILENDVEMLMDTARKKGIIQIENANIEEIYKMFIKKIIEVKSTFAKGKLLETDKNISTLIRIWNFIKKAFELEVASLDEWPKMFVSSKMILERIIFLLKNAKKVLQKNKDVNLNTQNNYKRIHASFIKMKSIFLKTKKLEELNKLSPWQKIKEMQNLLLATKKEFEEDEKIINKNKFINTKVTLIKKNLIDSQNLINKFKVVVQKRKIILLTNEINFINGFEKKVIEFFKKILKGEFEKEDLKKYEKFMQKSEQEIKKIKDKIQMALVAKNLIRKMALQRGIDSVFHNYMNKIENIFLQGKYFDTTSKILNLLRGKNET